MVDRREGIKSSIEDLLSLVGSALPTGMPEDIRRNVDATIRAFLENMDFVPRAELEVQEMSLRRTREKLTELEGKVAELERKAHASEPSGPESQ